MTYELMIMCILFGIYMFLTSWYIYSVLNCDVSWLGLMRNYKIWTSLNWFGVAVITLLLNVLFLPYAITIYLWRFMKWLFTVTFRRK